jgi:hypothetical protein
MLVQQPTHHGRVRLVGVIACNVGQDVDGGTARSLTASQTNDGGGDGGDDGH